MSESQLPNWLMCCAQNLPEHLAVKCGQVAWSFSELDGQARLLARRLATLGVQEESYVALLATNSLSYCALAHALTYLGAVLVPLNVRLTIEELCWQVRDAQAMMLVSDEEHARTAEEIQRRMPALTCAALEDEQKEGKTVVSELPEKDVPLRTLIDLGAVQAILYTSGTTGQPKGVMITYGMQWWNAVGSALNLGHRDDDCWLACLPFFHIGGLSILMRSVIYGISVIVQEKFDADAVNKAICEDRVTIISVVAVMLQRMLSALSTGQSSNSYPSTLRCVLLGGGPASQALLEDCARRHIPVVQTYGLTEACSQAVTLSPADALRKLGSAGRPLLPVQLRIMRDGQLVLSDEAGEIHLQGPTITPGYVHRPDATAAAIQDGWLHTGDIGYLDEEGYLYVLDRRADLIITGGENIYPAEIEAILLRHPDVEEVGVCGQADQQWGQVPVAFVHLHKESITTGDEIIAYASQYLARYKLPRTVYLLTEPLPRNSSGKLLRRELLYIYQDRK